MSVSSITDHPSRRDKRRADTKADIKAIARELLIDSGPAGISLRAIARRLNLSAPALYRYFDSLEALQTDLCADLYIELRNHLQDATDTRPPEDLLGRLLTAARGFRTWAIANQAEFVFMFASQVPDSIARINRARAEPDPAAEPYRSMLQFNAIFGYLFNRIYHQTADERGFPLHPPTIPPIPHRLREEIDQCSRAMGMADIPIEYTYTFHTFWIRLYGMVAMEVFGQLPVLAHAEALFEAELHAMANQFGVDPSAVTG